MPTPKGIVDAEIVAIGAHRPELQWKLWTEAIETYPVTMLPALEAVPAAKDPVTHRSTATARSETAQVGQREIQLAVADASTPDT